MRVIESSPIKAFWMLLFHPVLWCSPFLGLIAYSLYQVSIYGILDAKVFSPPFWRGYSCINVILFSSLWILSMTIFSKMNFDRMLRVYLSFCVVFSAYGVGETLFRVFWVSLLVEQQGLVGWLRGAVYALFFLFNNIPLYAFLRDRENSHLKLFLIFVLVNAIFLAIHYLIASRVLYYLSRFLAVSAYGVLLLGFNGSQNLNAIKSSVWTVVRFIVFIPLISIIFIYLLLHQKDLDEEEYYT